MKKIGSLIIAAFLFAACNNSGTGTNASDTTNTYDTSSGNNMMDTSQHMDTSMMPNKMQDTTMKK
jgi:PBP1b-binding outer membrane lipoprotein LpoB